MGAAKEKLKEAGNPFGQGIELGIYRERAPCHSHIAYFWECDADFAKAVGFLAVGLNGTDHCILLGHPEANEKVCAILTGEGHDVAALRGQGRLALISGAPNGEALRKTLQKTFQRALGQGAPLVRLLTNLGWNQEGWPSDLDLCALEAHLTEIATQFPCLVLCMYAAGSLPGFILHQAGLQTHPLVQHGSECGRNPFFTPTGQYLRQLPSIAEQITNSQLREETEWEVQKRFIALNEKAHICVFYTDSDGATVHVSRCWAELLGMAQPRATREAWMQTIHEEDRAPVLESWRESVENKAPFSFELRFLRADGHLLWASAHAIPDKDPQGNLLGWIGTLVDITSHKEAELLLRSVNETLDKQLKEGEKELHSITRALREESLKRARSAEAARRTQQRFATFMRHLPGLAFMKNAEGRYVYVNEGVQEAVGHSSEEWLGRTDRELWWPGETAQKFMAEDERVWKTSEPLQTIDIIPCADGLRHWFIIKFLLLDESGKGELVAGIGIDLTERKQMEEALQRSENFARGILDALSAEICVLDEEGFIIAVNKAWRKFSMENSLLPDPHLLEGANYLDVCDHGTAHHCEQATAFAAGIRSVIAGRLEEFAMEYECHSPAKRRWFIGRVSRFLSAEASCVVVAHENITERKLAEEVVRKHAEEINDLYNRAPCGYHSLDTHGVYVEVNETELNWLGYRREELVGKCDFRALLTAASQEIYDSNFPRFKESGSMMNVEFEMIRSDGSLLQVLLNALAIKDSNGRFLRSRSTLVDITERKLAEQKIEAALHKEGVLRREIHHRVKNNLQVISSLLFLQSLHINDPQLLEVLRESQSRTHSIGLIHELLCQREDPTVIRFHDYAWQLATSLFASYQVRMDAITFHVEAGDLSLDLDVALPCGLILTELISNALKYAFPKHQHGEIAVALKLNSNASYELTVHDNGVGLGKEIDLERAETLGLRLVRDLTRQLDGTVEIHGATGTFIHITFPVLLQNARHPLT